MGKPDNKKQQKSFSSCRLDSVNSKERKVTHVWNYGYLQ